MRRVKLCERTVKDPSRTLISPAHADEIAREMTPGFGHRAIPAPYALPVSFAMFLAGAGLGLLFRWYARRLTLVSMGTYTGMRAANRSAEGTHEGPGAIDLRRR